MIAKVLPWLASSAGNQRATPPAHPAQHAALLWSAQPMDPLKIGRRMSALMIPANAILPRCRAGGRKRFFALCSHPRKGGIAMFNPSIRQRTQMRCIRSAATSFARRRVLYRMPLLEARRGFAAAKPGIVRRAACADCSGALSHNGDSECTAPAANFRDADFAGPTTSLPAALPRQSFVLEFQACCERSDYVLALCSSACRWPHWAWAAASRRPKSRPSISTPPRPRRPPNR